MKLARAHAPQPARRPSGRSRAGGYGGVCAQGRFIVSESAYPLSAQALADETTDET
jgi:hypothetical protein